VHQYKISNYFSLIIYVFSKQYIIYVIVYIKIIPIISFVIYSYIHEWETYKNTKFYVIHNLSVQLNTNQTHMEVLCYGENGYYLNLLQLFEYVIDEWEHAIDNDN
jgi:hypothetical protein